MNHNYDMYYEPHHANRSPNSQRQLNRQPSRQQFEAYGHLPSGSYFAPSQPLGNTSHDPSGLYTAEDHAANINNGPPNPRHYTDRMNATIGGYGGYDMGGQSWNGGAFSQNNTMNAFGGTGRRNPSARGRAALPNVKPFQHPYVEGFGADLIS